MKRYGNAYSIAPHYDLLIKKIEEIGFKISGDPIRKDPVRITTEDSLRFVASIYNQEMLVLSDKSLEDWDINDKSAKLEKFLREF